MPLNDGTCLLDHYQNGVSYAPSCQLLQLVQNEKRPYSQNLFAIQNPTSDLTYTDLEVETISLFFREKDRKILAEQAATKNSLNTYPKLTPIHCVHFSCHGYFNMAFPLKSALLLADCYIPTPETVDPNYHLPLKDGRTVDLTKCLTLGEIFRFNLNQCRLVTLSACETGLIDPTNISDEYIGLPSGFLVAGSPAVVSSLWTVNDLSTALLMIKFYENLRKPMSLAVALNQAQLWLRDATKEDLQTWTGKLSLDSTWKRKIRRLFKKMEAGSKPFQSPYHWSAFTAVGE